MEGDRGAGVGENRGLDGCGRWLEAKTGSGAPKDKLGGFEKKPRHCVIFCNKNLLEKNWPLPLWKGGLEDQQ